MLTPNTLLSISFKHAFSARYAIPPMQATNRSMDTHHGDDSNNKCSAAAAERNTRPILDVLRSHLPRPKGSLLEIASGTGQHAAAIALEFPELQIQPSEHPSVDPSLMASIQAWTRDCPNVVHPPLTIDCSQHVSEWAKVAGGEDALLCDTILCVNMTHISPWQSTVGLFQGASHILQKPHGMLIIYGPFTVDGKPTTESNAAFDTSLKSRNSEWGLRDIADLDSLAQDVGLTRTGMIPMPAHNFTLLYRFMDD